MSGVAFIRIQRGVPSTRRRSKRRAVAIRDFDAPIEHYGVMRTYLTRHGVGPLPTHDESLDERCPNRTTRARAGRASSAAGIPMPCCCDTRSKQRASCLACSSAIWMCFERGVSLKWCERYDAIERLPLGPFRDLSHQVMLTGLLESARPQYAAESIRSEEDYLERLASVTDLPVVCGDRRGLRGFRSV